MAPSARQTCRRTRAALLLFGLGLLVLTPARAFAHAAFLDSQGYVAPEKQKLPENDGWANVGYILAVLLPVIGLLIGSTLSRRGDSRGPTIMIISAVVIAIALVVAALSVA